MRTIMERREVVYVPEVEPADWEKRVILRQTIVQLDEGDSIAIESEGKRFIVSVDRDRNSSRSGLCLDGLGAYEYPIICHRELGGDQAGDLEGRVTAHDIPEGDEQLIHIDSLFLS